MNAHPKTIYLLMMSHKMSNRGADTMGRPTQMVLNILEAMDIPRPLNPTRPAIRYKQ